MKNANVIAFIICTADEIRLQECLFYLNRLVIPEGYSVELFCVTEAASMAAGYNEGMKSTDARYKIYLHEDVHCLNRNLLTDLISVFREDEAIGMIGMVGISQLPSDGCALSSWDTGSLYQNQIPRIFQGTDKSSRAYTQVEALDGLFLATQHDLPWREELFDGWDYYDISQCFEFKKKGLKCVVPVQEVPWCYHDNAYSRLNTFHQFRVRFLEEYQDQITGAGQEEQRNYSRELEMEELKEGVRRHFTDLLNQGQIAAVSQIFEQAEYRGWLCLQEHELLARIYQQELKVSGAVRFPFFESSFRELQQHLWNIRWLLKRAEFDLCSSEELEELKNRYSIDAVTLVTKVYSIRPAKVIEMLERSGKGER